ncbi:MAG: nucleotidyltransferase domain-containing protein [Deltaproteobacteria bacterium]
MRISDMERDAIVLAVRAFDPNARLWLFGSRTDDQKRGGDIDVAILSASISRMEVMRIKRSILDSIGEQHLDLVVSGDGTEPFFRVAIEKGIPINA